MPNRLPRRLGQRYARQIGQLIDEDKKRVWKAFTEEIRPRIARYQKMITGNAKRAEIVKANSLDEIDRVLRRLRISAEEDTFNSAKVKVLSSDFVSSVNRSQRVAFAEQVSKIKGFDPTMSEPWLGPFLRTAIEENVSHIKSIPADYHKSIETIVTQGARRGVSLNEMAKQISDQGGVTLRRGKFIARDQLGSIYGDLTKARHQNIGLKKFKWVTSTDERVRDSHMRLHNQIFTWEEGATNERGETIWPGTDFNCRCYAEAIPSELVDAPEPAPEPEEQLEPEPVPEPEPEEERVVNYMETFSPEVEEEYLHNTWHDLEAGQIDYERLSRSGAITRHAEGAIDDYTGSGYRYMNKQLRFGEEGLREYMVDSGFPENVVNQVMRETAQSIEHLSTSFASGEARLPQSGILWRGITNSTSSKLVDKGRYTDPAFFSTSTDVTVAGAFAKTNPVTGTRDYIRLMTPKGTPAVSVARAEKEVILNRNTTVRVISVETIAPTAKGVSGHTNAMWAGPGGARIFHCVME